jgi:hypothetical protein
VGTVKIAWSDTFVKARMSFCVAADPFQKAIALAKEWSKANLDSVKD